MFMRQLLDISKIKRLRAEQDASQDATAGRATSDGGPSAEASEPPAQHQRREEEQRGEKRSRETSTPPTKTWTKSGSAHDSQNLRNREMIAALHRTYPGRLHLRAPPEATPVALLRQATSAARINDARVLTSASGREKSIHQWEELRMFDPGD